MKVLYVNPQSLEPRRYDALFESPSRGELQFDLT